MRACFHSPQSDRIRHHPAPSEEVTLAAEPRGRTHQWMTPKQPAGSHAVPPVVLRQRPFSEESAARTLIMPIPKRDPACSE